MEIDVTELSEDQLKKSATWRRYVDLSGMCMRCKEHTSLLDPCCGVSVYFEGGEFYYVDLWEKIDEDLKEIAKNDFESAEKERI